MVFVRASRGIVLLSLLAAMGCKSRDQSSRLKTDEIVGAQAEEGGGDLKVCAAVRGNGHYILTHFGALARITEHYGAIDALAGGSSATVTMFMHESMKMNPLVKDAPSARERDLRLALLLKSILGYVSVLKGSPEAEGIMLLVSTVMKAQQEGIFAIPAAQYREAAKKLQELLSNKNLIELINPRALAMLKDQDDLGYASYQFKVNELKASAQSITGFKATDQKIFFREGIINFDGLATALGRMADFYAGYAPINRQMMADFVESCSTEEVSAGKAWPEIAQAMTPKGNCNELFSKVLKNFRASTLAGIGEGGPHRVDEAFGIQTPSIVSTAVLEGQDAISKYDASMKRYRQGEEPKFDVNFEDVRFGYWVPAAIAGKVDAGMKAGAEDGDGKLKKYRNLGSKATWREVLKASPAEPGLSPGVPVGDRVSIGGWSDLSPVQVLQSAGCDKVVYVTRRQPESQFLVGQDPIGNRPPLGVAEQVNMSEAERQEIYVLANEKSGFARALTAAGKRGAVWCTDWNSFTDAQIAEMYLHSYSAEMVSRDPDMTGGANAYRRQVDGPIVGCTVP